MAPPDGARVVDLDGSVHAAWSDASAGDLRPTGRAPGDAASLAAFAADVAAVTGPSFTRVAWVTQVHGTRTVAVPREPAVPAADAPVAGGVVGDHRGEADALVADDPGTALCVLTADCAPLALASPEGVFGAVHAGWRGLVAGVVEQAVAAMRDLGASDVSAVLGPCIHAGCYEFGGTDLDTVEAAYGPTVRSTTLSGRPALDLVAAVSAAVGTAGARLAGVVDTCTSCSGGQFSHRARADRGRQALVVWSTRPRATA